MAKKSKKERVVVSSDPVSTSESKEVFFEDIVDDIVERIRATLVNTYGRRDRGAFSFGLQGLVAVATEQLTQARDANDLYNSATFVLAATLLSLNAYGANRRPKEDGEKQLA